MSQPVWFNPLIKLKGLVFSTDPTIASKWAPLAAMEISTLRDLWDPKKKRWFTPSQLIRWAHLYLPDDNSPHLRLRILFRARELLQALPHKFHEIMRRGPSPYKVGQHAITDENHIGSIVHVGELALSIRHCQQDEEGLISPSTGSSAHVYDRVQPLITMTTKAGKQQVVGPAEGRAPILTTFKLGGVRLLDCETRQFYKALHKRPNKKQRQKMSDQLEYWETHLDRPITHGTLASLLRKSNQLPLLHQEV